jgi:AcrR family transcriptional regulator
MTEARAYRSPRRAAQAAETRRQILSAARRLFSERGYAFTPINAIAAEAGVSVPTVYANVGSKAQLALALVEFINDEVDMASLAAAQFSATTPRAVLAANAHLARVLNEQCGDIILSLLSAAASSAEVDPAASEGRRVHREGCEAVAARLDAMGALAEHVDVDQAGAILATYTGPEAVGRLILEYGWSFDEVETWLGDAMPRLLLAADADADD